MRECLCIFIMSVAIAIIQGQPCDDELGVDISDGTATLGGLEKDGVRYPAELVYKKTDSGKQTTFGCLCKLKTCLRKCCPLGEVKFNKTCTSMPDQDLLSIYGVKINSGRVYSNETRMLDTFGLLFGIPCRVKTLVEEPFIQRDGSLTYEETQGNEPNVDVKSYCLESFTTGAETKVYALVCVPEPKVESYSPSSAICMLVSCVFFLLTLAVYAWLPELRNLNGLNLMACICCMFVGFLATAVKDLTQSIDDLDYDTYCLTMTLIIYYSMLSAFFWLNVISFDIWWTFRIPRMGVKTLSRFIVYAIYAFSVPAVLTILIVCLQFSGLPDLYLMPRLVGYGCFFYGPSKLLYFYGPLTVLMLANAVFFALTTLKIAAVTRQTSVLNSAESRTNTNDNEKQRMFLYLKLFAVMGITWILEVVSELFPTAKYLWIFTDTYNVLIGLTIFIIFVCKSKTIAKVKKRYYILKGVPLSRNQTTTTSGVSGSSCRDGELTRMVCISNSNGTDRKASVLKG